MHSLAGVLCALLCVGVFSQTATHVYVTFNNVDGADGVAPGPLQVPTGFGSVDGEAEVSYDPWVVVYNQGPRYAAGHYLLSYYNNSITVNAIPGYTVRINGMEYESFQGQSGHPSYWYLSCGSGVGNVRRNIPVTGSWPNAASPENITWPSSYCSGNTVSMVWGDQYQLVVSQFHYSIIGNNACLVNNGGCGAGLCSYGGPGVANCDCNPGYQNVFGTCVAINNCATNNGGCDPLPAGACFNDGPGVSHCDCADGYEEVSGACTDINECTEYPDNAGCGDHGICTNTPGSYFCTCNNGYSGDGTFCTANANCLTDCGPNAYCAFAGGIYTCQCVSSGFVGTPPSVPCTDVNECAANVCGVGANIQCVNTPGTYICYCPSSGYSGNGTGAGPCLDIDECGATPTICGAQSTTTCINVPGTYECECHDGFTPAGVFVGHAPSSPCTDINECSDPNWCPQGSCTNLIGSYYCTACNRGYYRNVTTRQCLDLNECALGYCYNGTGACQNTIGSFVCCGVDGYASQAVCSGAAEVAVGSTVTARQGAIYFSYALAALIVCVASVIMFLLCRKRHKRRQHIERLRGHANMEEEMEMSPRGTAGDMLNQPLEGDLLDEPKETNDEDPAGGGPFGHGGKRESSQDLMGATAVAKGSGKHVHSSSSSASELAGAGGTKEGDVYVGAAPAENMEIADDDRPADGDFVMIVSPVHGAHQIPAGASPNVRVLANDQRSQEFKAAKINAVAVANAASVLAVSALGGSPRNHPSQPLPSVYQQHQQQQQRLAPQVMLRAPMNIEPAVPASPGKRVLPVVPDADAEAEAETREPEGPRSGAGGLEVPDDPYGGENSQNSAHSVNRSQNAMHMANIGEPQIDAEDDQHDGIANPNAAQPFDYDEEDDGEPTAALNPADKKKSDKKRRQEEEKRRKAEKAAEEKRKKEAKAEEEKAKKERKNAEKAEAERLKREKNNMDAAQRTQQEKESAIRAAFAKLRGQVPALEQEQQLQQQVDDEPSEEVLRQPEEAEAEPAAEEEPAETNNHEGGNSRDVTPKASPKEGGHAQEGRPSENNNSPAGSRHAAAAAPAVAPNSVGSASFGNNPLNVHASASQGHLKKNSGANDYMSPSAMIARGSGSQGSGPMASAMAAASPSDEARNVPPNLLRMTSEGLPRQRHSSSSAAAHTVTLRDVLTGRNRACLQAYSDWCHAENAEGPLKFYVAVEEYRHQKAELEQKYLNEEPLQIAEDLAEKANDIFKQHLNPNAKGFLNLPEDVATRLAQRSWKYHKKGEMEAVLLPSADGVGFAVAAFVPTVFDESQEVVFKMMEADSWFRFMKTDRAKEFGS